MHHLAVLYITLQIICGFSQEVSPESAEELSDQLISFPLKPKDRLKGRSERYIDEARQRLDNEITKEDDDSGNSGSNSIEDDVNIELDNTVQYTMPEGSGVYPKRPKREILEVQPSLSTSSSSKEKDNGSGLSEGSGFDDIIPRRSDVLDDTNTVLGEAQLETVLNEATNVLKNNENNDVNDIKEFE